jgi:hypothetical protein
MSPQLELAALGTAILFLAVAAVMVLAKAEAMALSDRVEQEKQAVAPSAAAQTPTAHQEVVH